MREASQTDCISCTKYRFLQLCANQIHGRYSQRLHIAISLCFLHEIAVSHDHTSTADNLVEQICTLLQYFLINFCGEMSHWQLLYSDITSQSKSFRSQQPHSQCSSLRSAPPIIHSATLQDKTDRSFNKDTLLSLLSTSFHNRGLVRWLRLDHRRIGSRGSTPPFSSMTPRSSSTTADCGDATARLVNPCILVEDRALWGDKQINFYVLLRNMLNHADRIVQDNSINCECMFSSHVFSVYSQQYLSSRSSSCS